MRLRLSWLASVRKKIETRPGLLLVYGALPLAYVIIGRLGLLLAVPPGYATAVFLPAGIAMAAMFMAGWATLPGTFLGSFVLNVWIGYALAGHFYLTALVAALGIAFASLMQAAVGGAVLRKVIGYPAQFDNSRELSLFLLLSPTVCLLSATISTAVLWALGVLQSANLITNWTTWWAGDALGVLVALPLMLILAGEPARSGGHAPATLPCQWSSALPCLWRSLCASVNGRMSNRYCSLEYYHNWSLTK
jgi:integral membrane sensor domain MASE1